LASKGKQWLIGCGVGCATLTVLLILVTVGGSLIMMRPFNKAVEAQKELTAIHGEREDYVPPPDGITADRMERFLAVRRELMNHCGQFEEIAGSFRQMEELDKGGDDPPVGEVLKGVGNIMGSVFSIAGEIGALNNSRNNELLKNGMGLGEYTWIYVLSYFSWLGNDPDIGLDSHEGGSSSSREVKMILQMMRNHARALEEVGRTAEANLWRDEAQRLTRSGELVPFAAGDLPAEITGPLYKFRDALESTFCPYMAEFELGKVQKRGFSYHNE
jgi:hypothetical protein